MVSRHFTFLQLLIAPLLFTPLKSTFIPNPPNFCPQFLNHSSQIIVFCVLLNVCTSTEIWTMHQVPHPYRKLTLPLQQLSINNRFSAKSRISCLSILFELEFCLAWAWKGLMDAVNITAFLCATALLYLESKPLSFNVFLPSHLQWGWVAI